MLSGCLKGLLSTAGTWWLAIFVQVPSSCILEIVVGTGTQQAQILCVHTHFSTIILIPAKSMQTWVFGLYLGQNWTESHDSSCQMKLFDILNKMEWRNIM